MLVLPDMESMARPPRADRFRNGERLGQGFSTGNNDTKQLTAWRLFQAEPRAGNQFKDLSEEEVIHKIRFNLLHFDVRVDFVKVTQTPHWCRSLCRYRSRKSLSFNKDGVQARDPQCFWAS